MRSNAAFIQQRINQNLSSSGTQLVVRWGEVAGGTVDVGTGALLGGTEQLISGTLMAFVHTTEPKGALRQHMEIEAGDLICDLAADPVIALCLGQPLSGTVTLASVKQKGPKFYLDDEVYSPAPLGESLPKTWDARIAGRKLHTTIVLRKAT